MEFDPCRKASGTVRRYWVSFKNTGKNTGEVLFTAGVIWREFVFELGGARARRFA